MKIKTKKLHLEWCNKLKIFYAFDVTPVRFFTVDKNGKETHVWTKRKQCFGIYESKREARKDFSA